MRLKAKLCREYLRLEFIVQLTHLCPNHKITYLIIFHISFCHHNIDFFAKPSIVLNLHFSFHSLKPLYQPENLKNFKRSVNVF